MHAVYGYGRASTKSQVITIAKQEELCKAHFKTMQLSGRHGQIYWAGWFPDAAVTAKIPWLRRPTASTMFDKMRDGDHVVISEKDRAFRSCLDACDMIEILYQRDIKMHVLDCAVDLSTDQGRCLLQVMASFAELDRRNIGRRASEALQWKARRGLPTNGSAPIGWAKAGKGSKSRFVENPRERQVCAYVAKLYDQDLMSSYEIVIDLRERGIKTRSGGDWYEDAVHRAYWSFRAGFPKMGKVKIADLKEMATGDRKYRSPKRVKKVRPSFLYRDDAKPAPEAPGD